MEIAFRLRPLGRAWLYWTALGELIRTQTLTLGIVFEGRPTVTFGDEPVKPNHEYVLTDDEIEELVKRVPIGRLPLLIAIAKDRCRETKLASAKI